MPPKKRQKKLTVKKQACVFSLKIQAKIPGIKRKIPKITRSQPKAIHRVEEGSKEELFLKKIPLKTIFHYNQNHKECKSKPIVFYHWACFRAKECTTNAR